MTPDSSAPCKRFMVKFAWTLFACFGLAAADRQTAPVRAIPPDPLPCNGFPEFKDIPLTHFFWLGAHDATRQDRTLTYMLQDGIRLLDLNLCSSNDAVVACSDPNVSLRDIADEVLEYARTQDEQVIMLHVNLADDVTFTAFEEAWDQVCKVHSDRTEGTNVYEKGECPFVFKKEGGPWSSLGAVVNYDPEMAQWEGDGEVVGVRSKIVLTTSRKGIHNTAYFSEPLWRSSPVQNAPDLDQQLHHLCKTSGAVGLQAYADPSYDNMKEFDAAYWDNAILSSSACDINHAEAYVNMIEVDQYEHHLDYLHDLQRRMVPFNFGKWQGRKATLSPSKLIKKERERDEL